MSVSPAALAHYALANETAAIELESIVFPNTFGWNGLAGRVFRSRIESLANRRRELVVAHQQAASSLRRMANVAQLLLDELAWRQSQRNDAIDQVAQLDVLARYTTDSVERIRIQNERVLCERHIRAADELLATAGRALAAAETRCAQELDQVARLRAMQPLAERLGQLSLRDFMAYKALVESKALPSERLNWTADGCSDRGVVTGRVDLAACQLHDFDYRNHDKTRDKKFIDKLKADERLGREMVRQAIANVKERGPLGLVEFPVDLIRAPLTYAGATMLGNPDASQRDDHKDSVQKRRSKPESRDK